MFFKPSLFFAIVWLPPLFVMGIFPIGIIEPLRNEFMVFVIFITIVFVFFDIVFGYMYPRKETGFFNCLVSFRKIDKFLRSLLVLWVVVYLINIVGSGGVPIIWVLTGVNKTYADFGLPTLGGLANLMRAFSLTIFFYLYFLGYRRKRSLVWIFILLSSAFIIETGRGNGLVLALHGVGVYVMVRSVKLKSLPILLVGGVLFLLLMGLVQVIRYSDGLSYLFSYLESQGFDVGQNFILALLVPTFLYWVGPVVNTQLNFLVSDSLLFNPYYSIQGFVPTIIREHLFVEKDYGILVNVANNTTSFFTPMLRDFGVYGAAFAVVLILGLTSWVYHRGRSGNLFFFLLWPPFFMSLFLSNFSLFYTSLVVVLFPVIVWLFVVYVRYKNF